MNTRAILSLVILAAAGGIEGSGPRAIPDKPVPSATPAFMNTCLITSDVQKLSDFYAQVLLTEPRRSGDDYVEFHTPHRCPRVVFGQSPGTVHSRLRHPRTKPQLDS